MNRYRVSKIATSGKLVGITEILADEYYQSGAGMSGTTFVFRNCLIGWRGQLKSKSDVATIHFDGDILVQEVSNETYS